MDVHVLNTFVCVCGVHSGCICVCAMQSNLNQDATIKWQCKFRTTMIRLSKNITICSKATLINPSLHAEVV